MNFGKISNKREIKQVMYKIKQISTIDLYNKKIVGMCLNKRIMQISGLVFKSIQQKAELVLTVFLKHIIFRN